MSRSKTIVTPRESQQKRLRSVVGANRPGLALQLGLSSHGLAIDQARDYAIDRAERANDRASERSSE